VRALGQVYSSLARYASSTSIDRAPNPHLISVLQDSLVDPQPFRARRSASLLNLTVSAENLRSRLAMLRVSQAHGVETDFNSKSERVIELTTTVCEQVVEFSRGHYSFSRYQALRSEVGQARDLLGSQADDANADIRIQLLVDLAAVIDVLLGLEDHRQVTGARVKRSVYNPFELPFSSSSQSVVTRHAIRLASALVVADVLVYLLGVGHGYWGPMTVALVLRAQNVSTFERGLFRIFGAILGVAMATVIVLLIAPTSMILVVIVAVVTWAGFATFRANYFLIAPTSMILVVIVAVVTWAGFATFRANYFFYSISITAVVVFLFVMLGATATAVAIDRLVDTLLGGAIAMIVSFIAPTWIYEPLPALVESTMLAQASFIEFLGTRWAKDDQHGYTQLEAARRKRVLAIEVLNAAGHEAPLRKRPQDTNRERQLLIQLDRSSLALLALQSLSVLHADVSPNRMQELMTLSMVMRDAASATTSKPLPDQAPLSSDDGVLGHKYEMSLTDLPFELLWEVRIPAKCATHSR